MLGGVPCSGTEEVQAPSSVTVKKVAHFSSFVCFFMSLIAWDNSALRRSGGAAVRGGLTGVACRALLGISSAACTGLFPLDSRRFLFCCCADFVNRKFVPYVYGLPGRETSLIRSPFPGRPFSHCCPGL